jgi:hypothetical protein
MKPIKILLLTAAVSTGWVTAVYSARAQTWTPTSAPSKNWEAVASSADGSKLIAAGMSWVYCLSTNSGSTWITNNQPQKGSIFGGWHCLASSADGTKLMGMVASIIWVSTNSGTTWFSNNVPGVSAFASVALSADGIKLVAVAGDNSTPGPIYISTNSGITLTQTGAPTNNWMSVASSSDGTKLVAAAMNSQGGQIYASTNSGLTWSLTAAPTNPPPRPILDRAFDKFRVATKFGFEQLDGREKPARAQSHEFAKRSDSVANRQQRFLPAQNTAIQLFVGRVFKIKK